MALIIGQLVSAAGYQPAIFPGTPKMEIDLKFIRKGLALVDCISKVPLIFI